MGADNVVLLFMVWTFTSVCHGDDDVSVNCEDVTGTVGEEVTLTCSVSQSQKCTNNCITQYRFQSPEIHKSEICKEWFPQGSCEQRNSFTCRFTPTTAMTGQFRFFVQTLCGRKTTEFTVTITERSTPEPDTKAPLKTETTEAGPGSKNTVIAAVVGFFIILIIIITLTIICKRKPNYQPQWIPVFLDEIHDEDNSNCPEDMI